MKRPCPHPPESFFADRFSDGVAHGKGPRLELVGGPTMPTSTSSTVSTKTCNSRWSRKKGIPSREPGRPACVRYPGRGPATPTPTTSRSRTWRRRRARRARSPTGRAPRRRRGPLAGQSPRPLFARGAPDRHRAREENRPPPERGRSLPGGGPARIRQVIVSLSSEQVVMLIATATG